jgi:hypothetical protein
MSRPSFDSPRSRFRDCDGIVTLRVAAKASAISSGVNRCRARRYTRSASVRRASTIIMFARSTACRHGDGRISPNAGSIRKIFPPRTRMLAGFTSRWARPASHMSRTVARASSITPSSTSASVISTPPSRNSVTRRYSRSGVISTKPYDLALGSSASRITRST